MSHASPNRLRNRRILGLTMVAAGVALVVFTFWPSGGGASPDAVRALQGAAESARSQRRSPAPSQGQYLYTRTQISTTSIYVAESGQPGFSFITTKEEESWIAPDGSGRVLTEPAGMGFPTSEDESAWRDIGSPELEDAATDQEYDDGELTFSLTDAPRDPAGLLEAIERREIVEGRNTDLETIQIIARLLHLSYGSPDYRGALLDATAHLDGVDFEGSVTDPTGRPGLSVSLDGEGRRHELIFDPDTGQLLAERGTVLDPQTAGADIPGDAPSGTMVPSAGPSETVVLWRLYLETGVVDSIDSRPE